MNNSIIFLNKNKKWNLLERKSYSLNFKGFGYLSDNDQCLCFKKLGKFLFTTNSNLKIKNYIQAIDGHFSFIYKDKNKTIACVDWIRAFPIFYNLLENDNLKITNDPKLLLKKVKINSFNYNAVIDFFSSGYTTGNRTIFKDIKQLPPGTILVKYKVLKFLRYKGYFPKQSVCKNSYQRLKREFVDTIDKTFSRIAEKNKNRMIFIPLSAGFDSRLVLSSLLRHNHKDITCFSYGLKNNSEIKIARDICSKLNLNWEEINTSPNIIKKFSKTEFYEKYMSYSDTFSSVPFIQDLPALFLYNKKKEFPNDTLIINGNTGDFISGGHIPKELFNGKNINEKTLIDLFIRKHFCLWDRCLKDPYYPIIYNRINKLIKSFNDYIKNKSSASIFETLEWSERQAKFVVTGQRVYDFLEMDWKLPLWEDPIKNFFENLDYENKFDQYFYKKVLIDLNWSYIWKDIPINKKEVYPIWMRPIRLALKAVFIPFGKQKWHKFEKNYINYWTSYTSSEALVPYFNEYKLKDNFRNGVSLRAIQYLKDHGVKKL